MLPWTLQSFLGHASQSRKLFRDILNSTEIQIKRNPHEKLIPKKYQNTKIPYPTKFEVQSVHQDPKTGWKFRQYQFFPRLTPPSP